MIHWYLYHLAVLIKLTYLKRLKNYLNNYEITQNWLSSLLCNAIFLIDGTKAVETTTI